MTVARKRGKNFEINLQKGDAIFLQFCGDKEMGEKEEAFSFFDVKSLLKPPTFLSDSQ